MIICARDDKNLILQASTRADEQAGGNGGGERREEHLQNVSIDLLGGQVPEMRGQTEVLFSVARQTERRGQAGNGDRRDVAEGQ